MAHCTSKAHRQTKKSCGNQCPATQRGVLSPRKEVFLPEGSSSSQKGIRLHRKEFAPDAVLAGVYTPAWIHAKTHGGRCCRGRYADYDSQQPPRVTPCCAGKYARGSFDDARVAETNHCKSNPKSFPKRRWRFVVSFLARSMASQTAKWTNARMPKYLQHQIWSLYVKNIKQDGLCCGFGRVCLILLHCS